MKRTDYSEPGQYCAVGALKDMMDKKYESELELLAVLAAILFPHAGHVDDSKKKQVKEAVKLARAILRETKTKGVK